MNAHGTRPRPAKADLPRTRTPSGAEPRYLSTSQQVLLATVEALAATPLRPQTVAELAAAMQCSSRDQVFRALHNLQLADWAGQLPGGGWRLTPRACRLSEQVRLAIADLHHEYLAGAPAAEERA